MPETIPYVRDLRTTAATIAAQHIAAGWHGRNEAMQSAAVEVALEAAAPFLIDAYLIAEAHAALDRRMAHTRRLTRWSARRDWRRAGSDPYRYMRKLQQEGRIHLRTVDLEKLENEDVEGTEA